MARVSDLYRINLTKAAAKSITVQTQNGPTKLDVRETEIAMLSNLFDIAANKESKTTRVMQLMDCVGAVENLNATEEHIDVDQEDMNALKTAFEGMAGQRPHAWLRCRDLLEQLNEPKLIDKKEVTTKD
jgi:hypothetical protein